MTSGFSSASLITETLLEYSILVYKMGKIVFTIFTIFAQKNPICVTNLRVLKILVKIRSLIQNPEFSEILPEFFESLRI